MVCGWMQMDTRSTLGANYGVGDRRRWSFEEVGDTYAQGVGDALQGLQLRVLTSKRLIQGNVRDT